MSNTDADYFTFTSGGISWYPNTTATAYVPITQTTLTPGVVYTVNTGTYTIPSTPFSGWTVTPSVSTSTTVVYPYPPSVEEESATPEEPAYDYYEEDMQALRDNVVHLEERNHELCVLLEKALERQQCPDAAYRAKRTKHRPLPPRSVSRKSATSR